jgi:hypothetical protein
VETSIEELNNNTDIVIGIVYVIIAAANSADTLPMPTPMIVKRFTATTINAIVNNTV